MSKRDVCPDCKGKSNVYYCTECIQKGNFYHSGKIPERYAEKNLRAYHLCSRTSILGDKAQNNPPLVLKRDKLICDIEKLRETNKQIQSVIQVEKSKKENAEKEIKILDAQNLDLAIRNEKFRLKINELEENKRLYTSGIEEKRRVISDMERRRKNYIKEPMLKTIVEDIFCFKEQKLEASSEDYENPAIRKMMRSIDEAAHTHYVRGRWVTQPHFPHGNFSLITTTLPASGDYIAYARARSKDEASYKREADHILAGVSFLNHMVNTVADIIKIPLPKRVNIRDFINLTSEDLEKTKFQKLVTRINANVLFLCLSQEVPSNSLLPLSPLINMNALFTNPTIDIGRLGSFEIPQSIIDLIDDEDEEDDFSDSDDSDSGEWNMVNKSEVGRSQDETIRVMLPDFSEYVVVNASNLSDIPTVSPPRRRISFDDTASSVVTSAAASVLSIFGLGNN